MKDVLVTFIIALVLGSFWNGFQQTQDPTAPDDAAIGSGVPLQSVTDSNFQSEVLDQSQPVLVDFYTQSCPHCKKMAPVLEQLAQQYSQSLKVVKMDIMDNPSIAHKYDIGGVPAFMLFDKGRAVTSFVGEMPKAKVLSQIKPYLPMSQESGEKAPGAS